MAEKGHEFLARIGKTRLRPGGVVATDWLLEKGNIKADSKVLEVACNMGTTLIHIAKKYGCDIIGVDLDEKAVEKAKKKIKDNDLEAFATFASDLDPASKAQLDRGARLVELLKQAENSPQTVEHQIISIWLASEGHFDNVPVVDIRRFEFELQDYLQAEAPEVFEQIKGGQPLSEESQNTLVEKTEEFKHSFQTTDGTPVVHDLDVDALSEDEIKKQTLKVKK